MTDHPDLEEELRRLFDETAGVPAPAQLTRMRSRAAEVAVATPRLRDWLAALLPTAAAVGMAAGALLALSGEPLPSVADEPQATPAEEQPAGWPTASTEPLDGWGPLDPAASDDEALAWLSAADELLGGGG